MKAIQTLLTAAVLTVSGSLAAQTFTFNQVADWNKNPHVRQIDGGLAVNGKRVILTTPLFPVDPGKSYTLKMTVSAANLKGKEYSRILFGVDAYDAKYKNIRCSSINAIPGSFTTVVADAAKGDKKIVLKNASRIIPRPYYYLVVNAKENLSDLPNSNYAASNVQKVEKSGDQWIVTFKNPLNRDVKAGTPVRFQGDGGSIYAGGIRNVREKPEVMTGTMQGIAPAGIWSYKQWPVGTRKARICILVNWTDNPLETSLKDISLTVR